MWTLKEILEFNFLNVGGYHLNLIKLIIVVLIFFLTKTLLWSLAKLLKRFFKRHELDTGRQYAVTQFIKYIAYTSAILLALETLGVQLSLLWAGSAALLVGVGLGLQQTFNDLISGLILLIEGTVDVDDILDFGNMVGRVTKIGLRTSTIETRDNIVVVVPNSKLVTDNVVNWSQNDTATRFRVDVGVAYSSDVDKVTQLILSAINQHPLVLADPKPQVQFSDFGNSSLDFILYFYSFEFFRIEVVRSELRYAIFRIFKENQIEIPFPQRDLWLKNPEILNFYGAEKNEMEA